MSLPDPAGFDPGLLAGVALVGLALGAGAARRAAAGPIGGIGAILLVLALTGEAGHVLAVAVAAATGLAALLRQGLTRVAATMDRADESEEEPGAW